MAEQTSTGPSRPRRVGAAVGRLLRAIVGVDEEVIGRVPSERPRYAALGGVVLGTATIAAFSMTFALSQVVGGSVWWLLVPAVIWGGFVLNLDRWLVATAAGSAWHRRFAIYLPRLLIAFVFGVIIAEPLVLRIFETAIVKHVTDERAADLRELRGSYERCNPEPTADGVPPAGPDCAPFLLSFERTPQSDAAELVRQQAEAQRLEGLIATEQQELARLRDLAVQECNGVGVPGTTGVPGVGRECRDRRADADNYAATNSIEANREALDVVRDRLAALQLLVGDASQVFQDTKTGLIDEKVAEAEAAQGAIGLLERFDALGELTDENAFLLAALWAIRIFFILIDCLPVLVKFFAGVTPYDRLIDQRLSTAEKLHGAELTTRQLEQLTDLESAQHETRSRGQLRREQTDLHARRARATWQAQLKDEIDRLTDARLGRRPEPRRQTEPETPTRGPAPTVNGRPMSRPTAGVD